MNPGVARVGLFLAGVQKAGTTSLFAYLAQHPQLAAPSVKETHVFDDEALDWRDRNGAALHRCFPDGTAGRIGFDATPIYAFWPPAMQRIRDYNPRARIILLFRDPIARAWSHWRMETRRGTETLPFGEAIRSGRRRLPPDEPTHPHWRDHSYVERGFYGSQLRRVLSLFPREQVLLLDSAALRRDHAATLDRIAAFLGIDAFPAITPRSENAAPAEPQPPAMGPEDHRYLQGLYGREMRLFAQLSGLALDHWPSLHGVPEGVA